MSWTDDTLAKSQPHKSGERTLIATAEIAADTLIGAFGGQPVVVPLTADARLDLTGLPYEHRHLLQLRKVRRADGDGVLCLGEADDISGIDYANHSCRPNAELRDGIFLYSCRAISPGEEITLDYRRIDIAPEGIECWCETPPEGEERCRI